MLKSACNCRCSCAVYALSKRFYGYCWDMWKALSYPAIMFKAQTTGETVLVDDYREAYFWLCDNTPDDARIVGWWDYGLFAASRLQQESEGWGRQKEPKRARNRGVGSKLSRPTARKLSPEEIAEIYNTYVDSEDTTRMWKLISANNVEEISDWLKHDPKMAFLRSADGRGPMWWAYEFRNERIVKLLIKRTAWITKMQTSTAGLLSTCSRISYVKILYFVLIKYKMRHNLMITLVIIHECDIHSDEFSPLFLRCFELCYWFRYW